jgi:cytochrome b561
MNPSTRNRAFQFSLAWLVFWTFVCALAAGIARSFIESGQDGLDILTCFVALGVWLAMTFVAIYLRIFLQRRWDRAAAMRDELEQLVKQRRAELEAANDQPTTSATSSATSSPAPGP